MAKLISIFLLLLQTLFAFGQSIRTISIDAESSRPLNLSEIAEKETPIVLDEPTGGTQNILLANNYLFIAAMNSILQYDLSGKFIRRIDCGGYVTANVASDTVKKELYVPVRDKIKCYDYSGNLKKEYPLETTATYCFLHKEILWIQSYKPQPDKSFNYFISKINLSKENLTQLPFEKKCEPFILSDGSKGSISSPCILSLYNDEVIVSFGFDNSLYKIRGDKLIPLIKWNITPPAEMTWSMSSNGYTGEYLFINYRRDDQFYFYLENMKTGKKFNTNKVVDDIFNTSGHCKIKVLNQTDFFFYIKDKSEIRGNSIGNIPLKNGQVIFIVKTK